MILWECRVHYVLPNGAEGFQHVKVEAPTERLARNIARRHARKELMPRIGKAEVTPIRGRGED